MPATARRCLMHGCVTVFTPAHGRQRYCEAHRWSARNPEPEAFVCVRCGATFVRTDRRRRFCTKLCAALFHDDERAAAAAYRAAADVAARRAPAPWPRPADPEPWTMVEALAFACQVADLRRERQARDLADALEQAPLDKLVAALRRAADAEVLARKGKTNAVHTGPGAAGQAPRPGDAQNVRPGDGPGDAGAAPRVARPDGQDGAGEVGQPAGGSGRGAARPDPVGVPAGHPGPAVEGQGEAREAGAVLPKLTPEGRPWTGTTPTRG